MVAVEKFLFTYSSSSHTCDLLQQAFKRYEKLMIQSLSRRYLKFVYVLLIKSFAFFILLMQFLIHSKF